MWQMQYFATIFRTAGRSEEGTTTNGTLIRIRVWLRLLNQVCLLAFTVSSPNQGHWSVQNILRAPSVWASVTEQLLPTITPTVCLLALGGRPSGFYCLRMSRDSSESIVAAVMQTTKRFLFSHLNSQSNESHKAHIFTKWRTVILQLPILLQENMLSL